MLSPATSTVPPVAPVADGRHLSAHCDSRSVALPLPGDRRLEPPTWPLASVPESLAGGLGRGRSGRGPDRR